MAERRQEVKGAFPTALIKAENVWGSVALSVCAAGRAAFSTKAENVCGDGRGAVSVITKDEA